MMDQITASAARGGVAVEGNYRARRAIALALLARRPRVGREARAFLRRCANDEKPLSGRQHQRFAKLALHVGVTWESTK